jgi:LacI family repressor for deo operon, udp, cdd, tsx, nupC, and nupG
MSLTIRDVAREAGVSTATVSRALRGLGNVDPATAEHVRRVADRLDYVVSPAASRLASGRTGSVAVLTPWISRWYFATLLTGIERVMQEAAIDLLLHRVGAPLVPGAPSADRRLHSRVDGVLVLGLPATSPHVTSLRRRRLTVTLVGSRREGMASVSIDDAAGARVATQHLVNLGYTQIGLITGAKGHSQFLPESNRLAGYLEVLQAAGLPDDPQLQVPGSFTIAGGEEAMNILLALRDPPDAVFAMSDEMAFGALRALRRHGLQAGRDIALVGFDGHDMADLLDLTTISQPVEELGEQGARELVNRLSDPACEPIERLLPTTLRVRGSTAPPA